MKKLLAFVLVAVSSVWLGTGDLPAQPFNLTTVTSFVQPIGVAAVGDKVYVTNYCSFDDVNGDGSADGWALWQMDCDGTGLTRVGNFTLGFPGCVSGCDEIYLAVSLGLGGWPKNIIYAIHGDRIFKISPDGTQFSLFTDLLPLATRCSHSGITFDDVGTWGFEMIATLSQGEVFRVKPDGTATLVTDILPGGGTCEGPDVAPPTFGAEGGNVCITCESEDTVKMARPDGSFTTISTISGFAPESCHFIPQRPCDCQGQFGFYTAGFPDRISGGLASDLATGAGNLIVTSETGIGGVDLITPSGSTYTVTAFYNPPGRQHEGSALVECALACTDPDPLTQGYWHRQCLGAGLITPGRGGRGPTEVLEPDFLKTLVPAVDQRLQETVAVFHTCEEGMDAVPPSDPCERALKQYTALLLNIASNRLQEPCVVDVSALGCSATSVGELVDELAALINAADPDGCKRAADCAGAVNEGQGIVQPQSPASASTPATTGTVDDLGIAPEPAVTTGTVGTSPATGERTAAAKTDHAAPAPSSQVAGASDPAVPVVLSILLDPSDTLTAPREASGAEAERTARKQAAVTSDDPTAIDRHLAVLKNAAATEEARKASEDALLTALGGGYDLDVRLSIALALVNRAEVAYRSILARHLDSIREEARELGNSKAVEDAERLLKVLDRSGEVAKE